MIYDDRRGGYINNVPGTFTRKDSDLGVHYANYFGGCGLQQRSARQRRPRCRPGPPVINNAALVANAINPVTYKGMRVSALCKINDDWNALITQTYQNMDARRRFLRDTVRLGRHSRCRTLSVTLFNPSYDKDQFREYRVDAQRPRSASSKLVYTGGYLVRNVDPGAGLHELRARQSTRTTTSATVRADNGLPATCDSPDPLPGTRSEQKHASEQRISPEHAG